MATGCIRFLGYSCICKIQVLSGCKKDVKQYRQVWFNCLLLNTKPKDEKDECLITIANLEEFWRKNLNLAQPLLVQLKTETNK